MGTRSRIVTSAEFCVLFSIVPSVLLSNKMNHLVKNLAVVPRNVHKLQVIPKRTNIIAGYARNPISTAAFILHTSIQAVCFFFFFFFFSMEKALLFFTYFFFPM